MVRAKRCRPGLRANLRPASQPEFAGSTSCARRLISLGDAAFFHRLYRSAARRSILMSWRAGDDSHSRTEKTESGAE